MNIYFPHLYCDIYLSKGFCLSDFLLWTFSYIDEAAKEKLAPFSSLSNEESYQSRDLEKVWIIFPFFFFFFLNLLLHQSCWLDIFKQIEIGLFAQACSCLRPLHAKHANIFGLMLKNFFYRHLNKSQNHFMMLRCNHLRSSQNKSGTCTPHHSMLHLLPSSTTKAALW